MQQHPANQLHHKVRPISSGLAAHNNLNVAPLNLNLQAQYTAQPSRTVTHSKVHNGHVVV